MTVRPGIRVGPYEIVAQIGAGGMGEVYRARDPRLGRDVAIKVLPAEFASDPERLRRFELEAKAVAALDHPNILALYDVGTQDGAPYLVTQLLEGESLRERLSAGALPVRRAVEVASQIAQGLAAAHEKGIVHRDLKPGNVFIIKDGQVKILDFGIAKLAPPRTAEERAKATTVLEATDAGTVLGTVGYMSPEQVLGKPLDARSDLFSLGVVLYEMLSGTRPFLKESAPETMAAILKEEPQDLAESGIPIPPGLDRIVRHCLEKEPSIRFQTARDIAFALGSMSQTTSAATAPLSPVRGRRRLVIGASGVILLVAFAAGLVFLGLALGKRGVRPQAVRFQQLTFRRGWVSSARFTADGQTVVYSASWAGAPTELFSTRPGSPESAALGYAHAHLLAVSPTGELALLRSPDDVAVLRGPYAQPPPSTLAVAPFSGGTPRDLVEAGWAADYSPDGHTLAVVRMNGATGRLEYPIGTPRADGVSGLRPGHTFLRLSVVRLSPDGQSLAYFREGKELIVTDLRDGTRTLVPVLDPAGLAWTPDGSEVWFADGWQLRAVSLSGRQRELYSQSERISLQDIARDGRVLLTVGRQSRTMLFRGEKDAAERDLTWLDWTSPMDLSADGRLVVFTESELGVGSVPTTFVRDTDGAPPVRLGEGKNPRLSPDGRFVTAVRESTSDVVIYPLGAGSARTVPVPGVAVQAAALLPDGKNLCVFGAEAGHQERIWLADLSGSTPRAISPDGVTGIYPWVTADGRYGIARFKGATMLYPLAGGQPRTMTGIRADEWIAALSPSSAEAFVFETYEVPPRVFEVDLRTGARTLFRELAASDRSGTGLHWLNLHMTPDGRTYVYTSTHLFTDLYLVEGLK